jgi:hypothetical protein
MSAAVAITEPVIEACISRIRPWWDTVENRSAAAKLGWQRRKNGYHPTIYDRWSAAVKVADPCRVRLYCADVAETVQHLYLAMFPDDTLIAEAITVARAYATGAADDRERLRVHRLLAVHADSLEATGMDEDDPAIAALDAAGICLLKRPCWLVWSLFYAELAASGDKAEAHKYEARHLSALEAFVAKRL